jgi:hypothetical protein
MGVELILVGIGVAVVGGAGASWVYRKATRGSDVRGEEAKRARDFIRDRLTPALDQLSVADTAMVQARKALDENFDGAGELPEMRKAQVEQALTEAKGALAEYRDRSQTVSALVPDLKSTARDVNDRRFTKLVRTFDREAADQRSMSYDLNVSSEDSFRHGFHSQMTGLAAIAGELASRAEELRRR